MSDFEERQERKEKINLGDIVTLHKYPGFQWEVIEISHQRDSFKLKNKSLTNEYYIHWVSIFEINDVVRKSNIKVKNGEI